MGVMHINRPLKYTGLALTALGGFLADTALAQLDEIVVVAQRKQESLQDVPIAVSVIGGEDIERFRFQNTTQIIDQIPNMTSTTAFGTSSPLFTLRGISNAEFNPSSNTPVPVYSDDVLINSITAQGFALFDVDRVEVLRGPQGTLFGYNASAGAVHFLSRRPTETFEASASASYATHKEITTNAAVSGPIAGDRLLGRLSFYSRDDKGTVKNINTGQRIGEDERWAVRGLLDLKISESTDLLLKAQYGKFQGDPAVRPTEQDVNNFTGEPLGGDREIRNELGEFEDVESTEVSARIHTDFGTASLDLVTAYLMNDSALTLNFFDGTQVGLLNLGYGAGPVTAPLFGVQGFNSETWQFSQEVRLSSQLDGPFQYVVGAYYLKEELDGRTWFFGGDDSGALGLLGATPAAFVAFDEYTQELSSAAAFSQTYYDITDALKLTLGARISWDSRDLDLVFANFDGLTTFVDSQAVDPFDVRLSDITDLSGLDRTNQGKDWTTWSGRVALDYRFADDTLVYGSVSRGVKSGAFNTSAFVDISEANSIDPEKLLSYELGAKTRLADDRVQLNGAVFFYDVSDYHQKVVDLFGREFLSSAEEVDFYGFELESVFTPIDDMTIQVGVGWQRGEFKKFDEPSATGTSDRSGNIVPGTDAWNINSVVRHDFILPNGLGILSPQVEFTYTEGSFYGTANSVEAPQLTTADKTDDIYNLNLRLSYLDPSERFGLTVFAQNVLDEYKATRRNPVSFLDSSLTTYTAPRRIGVSLSARM